MIDPSVIITSGIFLGATIFGVWRAGKTYVAPVREAANAIRSENAAQTVLLGDLKTAQESAARSMQDMSIRLSTMDARQERESSDLYRRIDTLEGVQDSHAEAIHVLGQKAEGLLVHVTQLETIVQSRAADKDGARALIADMASDPPTPRS